MNYPNAIWRPGPAFKVNGGVNACHGVTMHSMVGPLSAALGELGKPERRASWHYSVCQNGTVYAHYADEAQTWHAGSARNNDLIGIEHEGGVNPYDEPLTFAQSEASVALVRWLSQKHGFPLVRGVGLYEHNEVTVAPTACPSGRIPWQHYTVQEEEAAMKPLIVWDLTRQRVYIIGGWGAAHVVYPADAAALEAIYGPPTVALSSETIEAFNR